MGLDDGWECYCNDKSLDIFLTAAKAEAWLEKMTAADAEQEFTWSVRKRSPEKSFWPRKS